MKKLDELGCPSWVRSEEGRTPVHVAAEQGWLALIDLLVRELRNKVDSRDAYQFTPLHSAANGGHVGTIQKLIHFNHDVDVRDYLGGLIAVRTTAAGRKLLKMSCAVVTYAKSA